MDTRTAVERLTFSDESRGWDWIYVAYDGEQVAVISPVRKRQGWYAEIGNVYFRKLERRADAKQAVIAWFSGLDIDPGN